MTADKTGAATTVTAEDGQYTIAVEGKTVGLADFADRGDQRVFYHTVIDPAFGGRGLATILVEEALNAARGRRQAHCPGVLDGRPPCSRSIPNSTTSPIPSRPRSSAGYSRNRRATPLVAVNGAWCLVHAKHSRTGRLISGGTISYRLGDWVSGWEYSMCMEQQTGLASPLTMS